jgi:restriction endonuclease
MKVEHNVRLPGRISGISRQIDVLVRTSFGGIDLLYIIDCKDKAEPLDIKEIGEATELRDDVGAHRAAIVSASGFTKAARPRAAQERVELLELVDAADHDWSSLITLGVVIRQFSPVMMRSAAQWTDPRCCPQVSAGAVPPLNAAGVRLTPGELYRLMAEAWNAGGHVLREGIIHVRVGGQFYGECNGRRCAINLAAVVELVLDQAAIDLPAHDFAGFKDVVTGDILQEGVMSFDRLIPSVIYGLVRGHKESGLQPAKPIFDITVTIPMTIPPDGTAFSPKLELEDKYDVVEMGQFPTDLKDAVRRKYVRQKRRGKGKKRGNGSRGSKFF